MIWNLRRQAGVGAAVVLFAWAGFAAAQPPLEALPYILQLQPSQHPAWRDYKDAAALRQADSAHTASQTPQINAMATPARLDAVRAQLQSQSRSFEREAAATQAFYAVLSPEQKQIFDRVTRLPSQPSPMRLGTEGATPPSPQVLRVPPSGCGLPSPGP